MAKNASVICESCHKHNLDVARESALNQQILFGMHEEGQLVPMMTKKLSDAATQCGMVISKTNVEVGINRDIWTFEWENDFKQAREEAAWERDQAIKDRQHSDQTLMDKIIEAKKYKNEAQT